MRWNQWLSAKRAQLNTNERCKWRQSCGHAIKDWSGARLQAESRDTERSRPIKRSRQFFFFHQSMWCRPSAHNHRFIYLHRRPRETAACVSSHIPQPRWSTTGEAGMLEIQCGHITAQSLAAVKLWILTRTVDNDNLQRTSWLRFSWV